MKKVIAIKVSRVGVCIIAFRHECIISHCFFRSGEKVALESVDRHPYQPYLVVTGSSDGVVGVWDLRHERYPVTMIDAHDSEGTGLVTYLRRKNYLSDIGNQLQFNHILSSIDMLYFSDP